MILSHNVSKRKNKTVSSYGPFGGENRRDLGSRIKDDEAVLIENFFIDGDGKLVARQGLSEIKSGDITYDPKMLIKCGNDILIYAYYNDTDTILNRLDVSTGTETEIYTYAGDRPVQGVVYDKYLYFCDGLDGSLPRVAYKDGMFLDTKSVSTSFTAGETITSVGGATAKVTLVVSDTLILLSEITGTFVDNENITDPLGGSGKVDGEAYKTYELSNAPKCNSFFIMEHTFAHLVAVGTDDSDAIVHWSRGDDNVGIPFLTWVASDPLAPEPIDAGFVAYKKGGKVNSSVQDGENIFNFYDDAITVFDIENVTVQTGTAILVQNVKVRYSEEGYGGYKNAIKTKYGVFYCNEKGVYQIISSATGYEGVSISDKISGEVEELDFSDTDIQWDGDKLLFITCKKDSTHNNYVKVYDMEKKAWSSITGWNIKNMTRIGKDMYGIDSLTGAIYRLLDGYNDNGSPIYGRVLYGIQDMGGPVVLKKTREFWIEGVLSESSVVGIAFHVWDKKNNIEENKKRYNWTADGILDERIGFGIGKQQYGEGVSDILKRQSTNLGHKNVRINNALKYQLELNVDIETPLEIHYYSIEVTPKRNTRTNNLSVQ